MPELPEVETLARCLRASIVGRRVTGVFASGARLREPVPDLRRLVGRALAGVRRHGKFLMLDFDRGSTLLLHLGMSGRLSRDGGPHTHVRLDLAGVSLHFVDPRRFGLVRFGTPPGLGPDALDPRLGAGRFAAALARTRRAVKEALLDQRVVAGLGNIYVCEALHAARIDPRRPANRLRAGEVRHLLFSARAVLRNAVAAGGTTLDDEAWRCVCGRRGEYRPRVYGAHGCPDCGGKVLAIRQGARSTYLCPACQRRPRAGAPDRGSRPLRPSRPSRD